MTVLRHTIMEFFSSLSSKSRSAYHFVAGEFNCIPRVLRTCGGSSANITTLAKAMHHVEQSLCPCFSAASPVPVTQSSQSRCHSTSSSDMCWCCWVRQGEGHFWTTWCTPPPGPRGECPLLDHVVHAPSWTTW